MENVKKRVKPHGHFINDRKTELIVGIILFLGGSLLLYDAWTGRGRNAPWPLGAILPF